MLAPQNAEPSIGDIMGNSMEEWYDEIDNCLEINETIPNTYRYNAATSYGNTGPITEGSTTFIDLLANQYEVLKIDNSYINVEMTYPITPSAALSGDSITEYYIGFKYAAAAISQYRIYSSTDLIYTETHPQYEWLLMYNSTPEDVIRANDAFASIDKIRRHVNEVPGVYVDLKAIANGNTTVNVKIPLKIPLNSFLMLHNLKWLPQWAGKIRIEVMFSYKNLVVAPVIKPSLLMQCPQIQIVMDEENNLKDADDPLIDLGFYQLNMPMRNRITIIYEDANVSDLNDRGWTVTFASHQFNCNTSIASQIAVRTASYMIRANVFNALAVKYAEVPLLFPIQTIAHVDLTTSLSDPDGSPVRNVSSACTVSLRHSDTMFVLFKESNIYSTQRFVQPMLSNYQFRIDNKLYPEEAYNSFNDPRTVNMTLDALNINNSNFTSITEDMRSSMQPFCTRYVANATGALTEERTFTDGSCDNHFIAIPFCDDEVFQGGISSPATIQISLTAQRSDAITRYYARKLEQPTLVFMQDNVFKIRSVKPIGSPQCSITQAPVEQLISSNGRI